MAFQAILSLKRQVASIPKCSPGRCLLLHLQLHLPHPRQHRLHHRRHHLLPRLQHQHCLRAPPEPSWDRYSSWSYGKMLDPKRNPIKAQFWKDTRTSKEKKRSKQIKVKGDRNRSKEFEGYQKQMICNLLEGRYHILLVYAHKTSELMGGWHRSTAVAYTFIATIATCVFEVMLNHKQASSALFFSLTRMKVGFLARGLRQKVLESSHGDGFFSRISTREIWSSKKWSNLKVYRFHCDNWVWNSNDPSSVHTRHMSTCKMNEAWMRWRWGGVGWKILTIKGTERALVPKWATSKT